MIILMASAFAWGDSASAPGGASTVDRPTVLIPLPLRNSEVKGKVPIVVSYYTSGPHRISRLDLYIDGYLKYTETINPPEALNSKNYQFDTTQLTDSVHQISAKVYDTAGNTAQASVDVYVSNTRTDNQPPIVAITNPKPNQTVSGKTSVDIVARDNVAVKFVILLVDGALKLMKNTPPFSWVWDTLATEKGDDGKPVPLYPNGPHQLVAKALDAAGNEGVSQTTPVYVYNPENDPSYNATRMQSGPIIQQPSGQVIIEPVGDTGSVNATQPGVLSPGTEGPQKTVGGPIKPEYVPPLARSVEESKPPLVDSGQGASRPVAPLTPPVSTPGIPAARSAGKSVDSPQELTNRPVPPPVRSGLLPVPGNGGTTSPALARANASRRLTTDAKADANMLQSQPSHATPTWDGIRPGTTTLTSPSRVARAKSSSAALSATYVERPQALTHEPSRPSILETLRLSLAEPLVGHPGARPQKTIQIPAMTAERRDPAEAMASEASLLARAHESRRSVRVQTTQPETSRKVLLANQPIQLSVAAQAAKECIISMETRAATVAPAKGGFTPAATTPEKTGRFPHIPVTMTRASRPELDSLSTMADTTSAHAGQRGIFPMRVPSLGTPASLPHARAHTTMAAMQASVAVSRTAALALDALRVASEAAIWEQKTSKLPERKLLPSTPPMIARNVRGIIPVVAEAKPVLSRVAACGADAFRTDSSAAAGGAPLSESGIPFRAPSVTVPNQRPRNVAMAKGPEIPVARVQKYGATHVLSEAVASEAAATFTLPSDMNRWKPRLAVPEKSARHVPSGDSYAKAQMTVVRDRGGVITRTESESGSQEPTGEGFTSGRITPPDRYASRVASSAVRPSAVLEHVSPAMVSHFDSKDAALLGSGSPSPQIHHPPVVENRVGPVGPSTPKAASTHAKGPLIVRADIPSTSPHQPHVFSPIAKAPPFVTLEMPRDTGASAGRIRVKCTKGYYVKAGDTIVSIAREYGVTTRTLMEVNGISDPSRLRTGQKLVIPPGPIIVYFDSRPMHFDTEPTIFSGIALGPFRAIFERGGGVVQWIPKGKRVFARTEAQTVKLQIGSDIAFVNESQVKLDLATFLRDGRTIVPLRFFKVALGVDVNWDPETGSIEICSR